MKTLEIKGGVATYVETPDDSPKSSPMDIILECKAQLTATDYKAIKYAEGLLTNEEYAPIKAERQALRDRINELEKELGA